MAPLEDRRIAVIGGDAREAVVAHALSTAGARVRTHAVPRVDWLPEAARLEAASLQAALEGAQALVLPMPGTDPSGRVHVAASTSGGHPSTGGHPGEGPSLEAVVGHLAPGTIIFVGVARPALAAAAEAARCPLEPLADDAALAYLNGVPTAEGAIALAMEQTVETLSGADVAVLGFGRTGRVLAAMLRGMGSRVTVAARRPEDRAAAQALGYRPTDFPGLARALEGALAVFNTVPAPVLGADALAALRPGGIVIDVASAPGGTDFVAARQLGVRALLAPGLPGKRAPRTAGENQARVILDRLEARWAATAPASREYPAPSGHRDGTAPGLPAGPGAAPRVGQGPAVGQESRR